MECISKSTTTNTIGQLEKLAIIAKLVCKYIQVDNIFSVIDLACSLIETMDELKFFNVSIDDLYHEYMSEHLEKRALFFNIVAQHWPKILEELDLDDCQNTYVLNKIEGTNDEDVCAQMPIIFSVDNIFEEVKCVFDIAKENIQKRIYIIADDKNFAIMLAEKFKNEGVEYGSYLESDKIDLDEITETFGCQNINQAKRIAQTINTYQNCVEQGNRILITNNRSLNTMIDESGNFLFSKETEGQAAECNTKPLIIASCMTGRQYGSHVISSYWLQDQVRTKLG
ncbi:MAG: hypothetical protein LBG13_02200, partial [Holosporales bacterium]|nr:hypothetical protein [Holosporales bacterium]